MRSRVVALAAAVLASPALAQTAPPPANPPPATAPPAYTPPPPYTPPPAYTPPPYAPPPRHSTLYLALAGGGLFPNDVTASGSGTIGGVSTSASGTVKLKDTYVASGILGIQLGQFVSFEIEGGYTHIESKSATGTLTRVGGTATQTGARASGNAYLGFGNLLIWPLGADALLAPYLGGGGGVAAFKGSALVGDATSGQITISTDGRQTTPAAAAIAGIDVGGPGLFRIGARYKYMWLGINNSRNFKEVQAQAVMGVLSARF